MRKIIVLVIFIIGFLFFGASSVKALADCVCVEWKYNTYCGVANCGVDGCCSIGICVKENCAVYCESGFYPCNRGDGCCPVGGGGSCEVPTQCGTYPNCYSPNCEDCLYGCSQATCGGGVCDPPPPTPEPSCTACYGCATAGCGECSSYAAGWRCVCSGSCLGGYAKCVGVRDSSCGGGDEPPTPKPPEPPPPPDEPDKPRKPRLIRSTPSPTPTPRPSPTPTPIPAWWQVKDSDVTTNGDIVSRIYPAGVKFILDGAGGYPGVASYGAFEAVFGNGSVSSKRWLANTTSTWLTARTYGFKYLKNLVPGPWLEAMTTTPGTISTAGYFKTEGTAVDGYKVFYHSGSLTVAGAQDTAEQRVILFVDGGDLTINGNISLTDGLGFFMAVVKGNIIINPVVTSLEGFYLADNEFRTGAGSAQLTVRGSAAGLGGVLLQRNLGAANTTTPAEVFEYAPDLAFTYPRKLGVRRMRWKEVAP